MEYFEVVKEVILGWYIYLPLTIYSIFAVFGLLFSSYLQNRPYVMDENGVATPNNFGVFTSLSPGQVKIIERGDTPVKFLMSFGGHSFQGGPYGDLSEEENYKIETKGKGGVMEVLPIPKFFKFGSNNWFFSLFDIMFVTHRYLWWICKVIIYIPNGMIFTGIPPWQKVRIYKLEYLKLEKGQLVTRSNYSDHFRAMPFDVYIKVPSVETNDNVVLEVTFHLICKVVNPWKTAYKVTKDEGWYNRINGLLAGQVRDYYREKTYDQTLSGKTDLIEKIVGKTKDNTTEMKSQLNLIGIEIDKISVYDQSVLDKELMKSLGAVAIAKANATARGIEAEAEADAIKKIVEQVVHGGEQGNLVYRQESTIRAIEAAPEGALISINTTPNSSEEDGAVKKGILVETRKANKK